MSKIRVTKLKECDNPNVKAGDARNWKYGDAENTGSLPIDYYIEGRLIAPISIGASVQVDRDNRNGVKIPGLFMTSPVTKVTERGFETKNSVYLLENI